MPSTKQTVKPPLIPFIQLVYNWSTIGLQLVYNNGKASRPYDNGNVQPGESILTFSRRCLHFFVECKKKKCATQSSCEKKKTECRHVAYTLRKMWTPKKYPKKKCRHQHTNCVWGLVCIEMDTGLLSEGSCPNASFLTRALLALLVGSRLRVSSHAAQEGTLCVLLP